MLVRTSLPGLRAILVILLITVLAGPLTLAKSTRYKKSEKRELKFASEMAAKGLWREALFRWQALLQTHPEDSKLLNNLAVAYEALGELDKAIETYERSLELAADRKVAANLGLARKAKEMSEPQRDEFEHEDATASNREGDDSDEGTTQ